MAVTTERTITLGGKTYPARLTFPILEKAEAKTGKDYSYDVSLFIDLRDGPDKGAYRLRAADVHALAWACVDPDLTYEQVGALLRPSKATFDLRATLVDALIDGFAEVDEDHSAPFDSGTSPDGPAPASTSGSAEASTTA